MSTQTNSTATGIRSPSRQLRRTGVAATFAILMATTALVTMQDVRASSQDNPPVVNRTLPVHTAPASFSELAKRVTPAVVAVTTERTVAAGTSMDDGNIPGIPENSPFGEFFRRYYDEHGQEFRGAPRAERGTPRQRAQGMGSGFIIDAEGHIVTNQHVIEGADKVTVILNDGTELAATIVGHDKKTDLALLQVKSDKALPFVTFGNSATSDVGDWVMAVGNPFGLGGSVTAGIISARGRDIRSGPFDDFLQIDAPINKGNSGGPLFDMAGRVIGVNSAIYSPNGGSVGIGFAIPSDLAKSVIADLMDDGQVERGWLGVRIQPLTPDIADGLGLKEAKGALVADVTETSPAAKADIRQGDVILSVSSKAVDDVRALVRMVADLKNGTSSDVVVWRDGNRKELTVTIGASPAEQSVASIQPSDGAPAERLGLAVSPVTAELKARFGISDDTIGAVIVDVDSEGPAAEAGLRLGDVIVRAGNEAIDGPATLAQAINKDAATQHKAVLLMVERRGEPLFVAVRPAKA